MDERIDKGTGTTIGSTHDDLSVRTDLNCNGFPLTVDNFVRNGENSYLLYLRSVMIRSAFIITQKTEMKNEKNLLFLYKGYK